MELKGAERSVIEMMATEKKRQKGNKQLANLFANYTCKLCPLYSGERTAKAFRRASNATYTTTRTSFCIQEYTAVYCVYLVYLVCFVVCFVVCIMLAYVSCMIYTWRMGGMFVFRPRVSLLSSLL